MSDEKVRVLLREIARELEGTGKTIRDYVPWTPVASPELAKEISTELLPNGLWRLMVSSKVLGRILMGPPFGSCVRFIGDVYNPNGTREGALHGGTLEGTFIIEEVSSHATPAPILLPGADQPPDRHPLLAGLSQPGALSSSPQGRGSVHPLEPTQPRTRPGPRRGY